MRKIILLAIAALTAMLLLVGCSSGNGDTNKNDKHTHSYTTTIVAPTCTEQGYTLHKCTENDDSFMDTYKNPLGHNFIEGERNYSCSRCGQSEAAGFRFDLVTQGGESCYVIRSVDSTAVVNGVLEVPRKYESLPVRAIANFSFNSVAKQVRTLIVHDNIKMIYGDLWHTSSIWDHDWIESTLETVIFDSTCSDMTIQSQAFFNCPNLKSVNLKKGMITSIPCDAVIGINGGNGEYLFEDTPYFKNNAVVKNGLYYIADLLLHADLNEISTDVVIDAGTVAINSATFCNATFIKSVTIPNSVLSIGEKAFYGCSNLETITYNGTVAEFKEVFIEPSAFSGLKATAVTCKDGTVTSYYYNGWTYHIGD